MPLRAHLFLMQGRSTTAWSSQQTPRQTWLLAASCGSAAFELTSGLLCVLLTSAHAASGCRRAPKHLRVVLVGVAHRLLVWVRCTEKRGQLLKLQFSN